MSGSGIMTEAFVVMVIWFGAGKYAQFDTLKFDNIEQCVAARSAIVTEFADTWYPINAKDIACIEVIPGSR